jgi:hypothetical protein
MEELTTETVAGHGGTAKFLVGFSTEISLVCGALAHSAI